MEKCFVSALFTLDAWPQRYDRPARFERLPGWDYLLFTNVKNLQTDWTIVDAPLISNDAILSSRLAKFQAHRLDATKRYKVIVYCDAYLVPRTEAAESFEMISHLAMQHGIVQNRHPTRNCPYEECDAIVRYKKDTASRSAQMKLLLQNNNVPRNFGLWRNTYFAYQVQNLNVQRLFDKLWQLLCSNIIHRDQPPYSLAIFLTGVQPLPSPVDMGQLFMLCGTKGQHIYVHT